MAPGLTPGSGKAEEVVISEDLLCPVLGTLFRDPVVNSTGNTYERIVLERICGKSHRNFLDPLTNEPFRSDLFIPNWDVRRRVQAFLEKHPKHVPDSWPDRSVPPPGTLKSSSDAKPAISPSPARCELAIYVFFTVGLALALSFVSLHSGILKSISYDYQYLCVVLLGFGAPMLLTSTIAESLGWTRQRSMRPFASLMRIFKILGFNISQLAVVGYHFPHLVFNSLTLSGATMVTVPAVLDAVGWHATHSGSRFIKFLVGHCGGNLLVLGIVAWFQPDFAQSPTTIGGAALFAVAKALRSAGLHVRDDVGRLTETLIGCSGIAWISFGALAWRFPACATNALLYVGATLVVIGSAIFEIDQGRARWISLGGITVLSTGLATSAFCELATR